MANPPNPAPPLADSAQGTPSLRTLGTGSQQAAAGNDSRLSTPTNAQTTPAANKIPLADGSGVIAPAWLVDASASTAGKVNTSAQTFAGLKTFQNGIETSSLSVGLSSPAGRVHVLSESNSNTPTSFTTNHLVVGRAASTGANSGAVFIQYNSTGNEGLIGSLSPAVAWRNLRLAAANVLVSDPAGNTPITLSNSGTATATTFTSSAASGSHAFTTSNVGARLSLGNTARYIMDVGGAWSLYSPLNVFSSLTTDTISDANGIQPLNLTSSQANSASAVAVVIRSTPTYSTAGAKITSFRNGTTNEVASIDKDGVVGGLSFNSTAAAGADAFTASNVGARLSLGNTARYFYDDGVGLSWVGNLRSSGTLWVPTIVTGAGSISINGVQFTRVGSAGAREAGEVVFRVSDNATLFEVDGAGVATGDSYVATTATGNALTGGGANGPLTIASNTPDSHTSSTVPAIRLKANQAITSGDLLLSVENSTGARRFSVFENGGVQTDVRVTTPEVNSGGGLLLRASTSASSAHTLRADGSPTNIAVFSTLAGGTQASVSLAGDITGKSFSSTAASGAYAFSAPTGSRISLGNTSSYIDHNGSNQFTFNESLVAASAGFTTAGMFQTYGNTTATLNGVVADAANAVATVLRSNSAYTTAGAKITSFRTGTTEKAYVDKDGYVGVLGIKFGDGTIQTTAPVSGSTTANVFTATAGVNEDAFRMTNAGAKLSLGNTSRYLYDTGSKIAIAGASLQINDGNISTSGVACGWDNLLLESTSGSAIVKSTFGTKIASFVYGNLNEEKASITSAGAVSALSYASTVGGGGYALTTGAGARISLGDTSRYLYDDGLGYIRVTSPFKSDGALVSGNGIIGTDTGTALTIQTGANTGNPIVVRSGFSITESNANLVSFQNNTTQVAYIDKDGIVAGSSFLGRTYSSNATANQYAFTTNNTGVRFSLGNTARYIHDTGTGLAIVGSNLTLGTAGQTLFVPKIEEPAQSDFNGLTIVGGRTTGNAGGGNNIGINIQARENTQTSWNKIVSFKYGTSEKAYISDSGQLKISSILFNDGTQQSTASTGGGSGGVSGSGTFSKLAYWNGTGSIGAFSGLHVATGDGAGYLGLGTSTPDVRLAVSGDAKFFNSANTYYGSRVSIDGDINLTKTYSSIIFGAYPNERGRQYGPATQMILFGASNMGSAATAYIQPGYGPMSVSEISLPIPSKGILEDIKVKVGQYPTGTVSHMIYLVVKTLSGVVYEWNLYDIYVDDFYDWFNWELIGPVSLQEDWTISLRVETTGTGNPAERVMISFNFIPS